MPIGHLVLLSSINDMSGAVSNKFLLYADDSAIFVAGKYISKKLYLKESLMF